MKWKYQERIDTSLTGQPFIGKVGKNKERGNAYTHSCFSVFSNLQAPLPNQFNPHFLSKFNPDTVHVVAFYPKSTF